MITLAEAKVGMADHVDQQVVDEFRRSSQLLDALVFDDTVSPGTGGSTLVYGYQMLKTPSTAAVRKINEDYVPGEAIREERTAKLAILGGSFSVDRVLANTSGAIDEVAFQAAEKIKAASNEFHNLVINGVSEVTEEGETVQTGEFDGLDVLLTGTENEFTSAVDISTSAKMTSNGQQFLDELNTLIDSVDGGVSMILLNSKMLTKVRSIAQRLGYWERSRNEFGRQVETYNGIPMVDMKKYFDGSATVDVIPTTNKRTDIYAVSIGLNGFHGVSPAGDKIITSCMPDMSAPGAIKTGDVELVAGVVLKSTLKAAVLRGVQIEA